MKIKNLIKKILPVSFFFAYHWWLAVWALILFARPGKKLVVIGVTGTKGKTTTANLIQAVLKAGGHQAGLVTTANIALGQVERLNSYHMTMPGPFILQRLLAEMVRAGCRYAVVEVSSEGINQYRHLGLYPDIAVFTNLWPEHLPSHGGRFENYRAAKGKLFASLRGPRKMVAGRPVVKVIVANADSEHKDYFLSFPADKKITFGFGQTADCRATEVTEEKEWVSFRVGGNDYRLPLLGAFNVLNALPAIVLGEHFGLSVELIKRGLESLSPVPGRMEKISEGQDFEVLVDYAHEPGSLKSVLTAVQNRKKENSRVIILLGLAGGGRDPARRPVFGEIAARLADYLVITNDDLYVGDQAEKILEDIAQAAEKAGKTRGQNLFVVTDRREGIGAALRLARPDDIVVVAGKGAEQSIIVNGISRPWDDRIVVREEIKKILAPYP